jgi:pimeloyl-ACP methyl ester carboxylesterase
MNKLLVFLTSLWLVACQGKAAEPAQPIAESQLLTINNTKQFVMIRGDNQNNPVLLFVHGGPGVSELGGLRKYNKDLEKHFTVVYWDQRNAGKSYSPTFPASEIKLDKYIEDVNVLANYLKDRLKVQKMLLVGHSWGSRLGMYAVQKYPQHFSAFVSTGQEVAAYEGELQSYRYTLAKAKELKQAQMVQQLEAIGEPRGGDYRTMYKDPEGFSTQKLILLELNKAIYDGFTIEDLFANIESDEYTATEKANFMTAVNFTNEHILSDEAYHHFDFRKQFPEVKIPVFFIGGQHDYITPMPLARQYFDLLKAPQKQFILFEKSGHDPAWEEPQRFHNELIRIAKLVN